MTKHEYEEFLHSEVTVVTNGRISDANHYNEGSSIILEGILDKETDYQIYLRKVKCKQKSNGQFEINHKYGAIKKDQIVSLLSNLEQGIGPKIKVDAMDLSPRDEE